MNVAEQQQQPVLQERSRAQFCSRLAQRDGAARVGRGWAGLSHDQGRVTLLTSLRSQGWSWVSRAQSVAGVTRAYLKRFWMAEDVQMYLYKNSFPVCSEMALADMAT